MKKCQTNSRYNPKHMGYGMEHLHSTYTSWDITCLLTMYAQQKTPFLQSYLVLLQRLRRNAAPHAQPHATEGLELVSSEEGRKPGFQQTKLNLQNSPEVTCHPSDPFSSPTETIDRQNCSQNAQGHMLFHPPGSGDGDANRIWDPFANKDQRTENN